ncbi:FAD-dependent oxidoreductase [Bacteroides faecium]|uniref:FAD-dependent oxidoreductase n=1 Tax=Bacteroides faecium TaxID=2715212 RepID=A0A6H0KH30_9BACE|nr:FAD-dependent oxidoreductase [Bacteroides faecium]QIU92670.1 FAD-dependent oxidoreductase [Bacteroides faecium]
MKRLYHFIACILFLYTLSAQNKNYDVVIVGGTPGGIMTAIAAAREGKSVLLLERTSHIGGLPANGLGATDITTRNATTGLFHEFVSRNKQYYIDKYGNSSQQVKDCSDGYHFEPSVAEQTFHSMINTQGDRITVLYNRQFDSEPQNIKRSGKVIEAVRILNRDNRQIETYMGKVFVDATYEGDLGAAANIPFRVGRESRDEFNEICAGKIYRHWGVQFGRGIKSHFNGYEGYESEGTTYQGDNAVQAYNYRLCLTNDKSQMRPVLRPENYNRNEYISLIEDVWTGRNTGVDMQNITREQMEANRESLKKGNKTIIPGDPWGIAKITNMVKLPNAKTDANNQHMAFISTDLPEENWPWPTAGWEWRDNYAKRLKDYTLGLIWFAQNDKELPRHFREACKEWGLSTSEYLDNENFPRQVYVREGRRFEGIYFFTANDALPVTLGQRPPIHKQSIAASHYALDSHAVLKREEGRAHLEGFFGYESVPYTIPFGVMASGKVDNLLFPVPVSGSHIGFSTLRMEPCWMALGEAAGIAAAQMIEQKKPAQELDIETVQQKLIANKATLMYFKDISIDSPDFAMVQYMGISGYISAWNASLEDMADKELVKDWTTMSGLKIPVHMTKRKEILYFIYNQKIKQSWDN